MAVAVTRENDEYLRSEAPDSKKSAKETSIIIIDHYKTITLIAKKIHV